jgi:hypothetical protein
MIVLVIMATLSVLSSQSIQQAIKNKIKLQGQIDDMSQVRDALRIIERDVNLAFHYTDLETELLEQIKKRRLTLGKTVTTITLEGGVTTSSTTTTTVPGTVAQAQYNPNDPNDPLNQKAQDRIDPTTHFAGKDNQIYFPTLNTSRLQEGLKQADFIKVGYSLASCKRPGQSSTRVTNTSCLIRKSSNIVEGDISKQEDGVVLLTDVTDFKLRYFGKGKQDWVNDWDSEKGDGVAKGRFPDAVEVSVTIERGEGEKKKKISMQIVAAIRFPNNTAQDQANADAQKAIQNGLPQGGLGGGN